MSGNSADSRCTSCVDRSCNSCSPDQSRRCWRITGTMVQGHWRRSFRCKFRNLQQTGGTNRCCRRRNRHSLPRICSNLQRQVVLAQVMVALVLARHCTMAQGHWHRRIRCRSRNLQQTGGTNRCCRRRNPHSLPRTCNNLQRRVVPAPVRAARDHHWR